MVLKGKGVCRCGDDEFHFAEDDTVCIPPNVVHQICNTGDEDLYILATLAMAPVRVETDAGEKMDLPWDKPAA